MTGTGSQLLDAIVLDAEEGKLRIVFAGDLCQALMVPRPAELSLGASVTLRIRVRGCEGHQVFEGSAKVRKLDGGKLADAPVALRTGLMVAFDAPTFVRRRSPHDIPPSDDVFALPPDTVEERDPWSAEDAMNETVKLPASDFWTGDTAKVPAAPAGSSERGRPTGDAESTSGQFASVARAGLFDDEKSGPWGGSGSSIIQ